MRCKKGKEKKGRTKVYFQVLEKIEIPYILYCCKKFQNVSKKQQTSIISRSLCIICKRPCWVVLDQDASRSFSCQEWSHPKDLLGLEGPPLAIHSHGGC